METKIKITHEDLKDPRIDEIIEFRSSKTMIYKGEASKKPGVSGFIYRHWLHLLIAALIGALIVWGLLKIFNFKKEKPLDNEKKPILVKVDNEYQNKPELFYLDKQVL